MKITFIVPELNLSGGLRVVSIYAHNLTDRGHEVVIVSPQKVRQTIKQKIKSLLSWVCGKRDITKDLTYFENVNFGVCQVAGSGPITAADIPDADVVIATWWETAEWVNNLPLSKGHKVYFIQHHETHDWLPIERVERTYQMPLHKITIARWLVELLEKKYNAADVSLVPNSVELNKFFAEKRGKQNRPTIGFLFSEVSFKGVGVALDVIEKVRMQFHELRVIGFGSHKPEKIILPDYVELHVRPEQNEISKLYAQCDVWLCCSLSEGFGLTVLEAMACRTPVVSTKCGGPEDIITDGKNGYLCDVNDIDALTRAVLKLFDFNEVDWLKFSNAAYKHAHRYTWDDAATLFESDLINAVTSEKRNLAQEQVNS